MSRKSPGTNITFEMVPVPGGSFTMGSPAKEKGRKKDEGPQREVTVRPFYMGKYEVTWDAYHVFLDIGVKAVLKGSDDTGPDALTFPTPPYADETFGYGRGKSPNIAVTWHAAMELARWFSAKTGKTYRLPTEAEWEYACRAGTSTAYSFGDAPAKLGQFAWFKGNAGKKPQVVGGKAANPFGLFDMHGNLAEWVVDRYAADAYANRWRRAASRSTCPAPPATRTSCAVAAGRTPRPRYAVPRAGSPSPAGASRTRKPPRASGGTPKPPTSASAWCTCPTSTRR